MHWGKLELHIFCDFIYWDVVRKINYLYFTFKLLIPKCDPMSNISVLSILLYQQHKYMLAKISQTFNNLRADFFMPFFVILIMLCSLCPNFIFKLLVKERETMNSYMTFTFSKTANKNRKFRKILLFLKLLIRTENSFWKTNT